MSSVANRLSTPVESFSSYFITTPLRIDPFFDGCRLRKGVKSLPLPSLSWGVYIPSHIGFPSYSSQSAIGMAQSQHHKLKLSIKPKERSLAKEPQRLAEGLPYASIVKGYYGSVPCLYRCCEPCSLC
jgi:hypothetical protein